MTEKREEKKEACPCISFVELSALKYLKMTIMQYRMCIYTLKTVAKHNARHVHKHTNHGKYYHQVAAFHGVFYAVDEDDRDKVSVWAQGIRRQGHVEFAARLRYIKHTAQFKK